MCYFITTSLPKNADLESIRPIITEYGLGFRPLSNSYIQAQLSLGEHYFRGSHQYCDCGTAIGSRWRSQNKKVTDADADADMQKLRNKGWSEARIARWAESKTRAKRTQKSSPAQELKRWIDCLQTICKREYVEYIGFLIHYYTSTLTDETVRFQSIEQVPVSQVNSDFLLNIREDVYYKFLCRQKT